VNARPQRIREVLADERAAIERRAVKPVGLRAVSVVNRG
jgi:hypothetical protein